MMQRVLSTVAAVVASVLLTTSAVHAEIKSNPNYEYTGTTSDLAQQFFNLHADGQTAPSLSLATSDLPQPVVKRLGNASFERLPGLLQRALLWDSGYVFDGDSSLLVKVRPRCTRKMADIAVQESQYTMTAGCTFNEKCPFKRNGGCNMTQILKVTLCAAETVKAVAQSSMWAIGGSSKTLPSPYMLYHGWPAAAPGQLPDNYINAIHTVVGEVNWDTCPSEKLAGMIIPCEVYNKTKHTDVYCDPTTSELVETWLQDPNGGIKPKSGFKTVYLIPIIAGALVIVGVAAYCCVRKRKQRESKPEPVRDVEAPKTTNSNYMLHDELEVLSNPTATTGTTMRGTDLPSYDREADSAFIKSMAILEQRLLDDPHLKRRRMPYDELQFTRPLSKGAFGEVWLCHWNSTPLAVKKLLGHKSEAIKEIAGFIAEIQLTASLDHPHIIKLVGVAWSSMENLCMAMEYLPRGDVLTYLKANNDMLSWVRDKLPMALGVARALEYLHSRPTPIIHRDLKAKNVLLTDMLEVKLIDFGVSRDKAMETMTAGVGTPYWSAPEVLDGSRYTEKSDIYSFGVLLSELDNGCVPYQNLRSQATGEPLKTLQILNMIVTGKLRPEFRVDCPARISNLAMRCLNMDPSARPTAMEIVDVLSGRQTSIDYMAL